MPRYTRSKIFNASDLLHTLNPSFLLLHDTTIAMRFQLNCHGISPYSSGFAGVPKVMRIEASLTLNSPHVPLRHSRSNCYLPGITPLCGQRAGKAIFKCTFWDRQNTSDSSKIHFGSFTPIIVVKSANCLSKSDNVLLIQK